MPDASAPLEVAFSARKQVVLTILFGVFATGLAILGLLAPVAAWLETALVIVMLSGIGLGIYGAAICHKSPTALRLDRDGVTVGTAQVVPWTDLREMLVIPMKPAWLVGAPWTTIVAFMPQPGVDLPAPPHPRRRTSVGSASLRARIYQTNLIVMPSAMTSTVKEITDAAQRLGGIPVRWEARSALRRWVAIMSTGVLAGLLLAVISILIRRFG